MSGDATLGANIRAARERRKLSQQQLAARLGWPQSRVSRVESGRTALDAVDLVLVAGALGSSTGRLLQGVAV